jgi:hypothetical protein
MPASERASDGSYLLAKQFRSSQHYWSAPKQPQADQDHPKPLWGAGGEQEEPDEDCE